MKRGPLKYQASKREFDHKGNTPVRFRSAVIETCDATLFAQHGQKRVYRYRELILAHGGLIYPEYLLAVRHEKRSICSDFFDRLMNLDAGGPFILEVKTSVQMQAVAGCIV